ncbi:MAG: M20/M25/M40 family metallo-hydrolase [Planctomycetota bacterium]
MRSLLPAVFPRLTLLAAAVQVMPMAAQAPPIAERIRAEGLEHSQVMSFQDELCHAIGHRLTGSDNMTRACEWARAHFAAMGLEARLEVWDEWRLAWNREEWMGRILAPEAIELQVATPAWSAGTLGQPKGTLVPLPRKDEAVAALLEGDEKYWVWGPRPSLQSNGWKRLQPLIDAGRLLGTAQSAKSTGYTDKRYPNQIRVFGDSNVARGAWESRPTIPHIVVRDDQAVRIEELLQGSQKVTAQFEIRNRFRKGPIALTNVVADLVGSEKPDEMVIVCAHLDSWHQAAGATDNGTGTCSTLECARILTAAGARPRRTIRFCLWTGEEQGLLGSKKYVVQHRQEMGRVSAVFNHDSGTNWVHALTVAESMRADFENALAPVMRLASPQQGFEGPVFELTVKDTIPGSGGGSDHASFLAAGVPAWPWSLRGESQYGYGWHSQWDTYDLVIPPYQAHNATVFAMVALGIADRPELLSRDGLGKARPAQDATALTEGRLGVSLDGVKVTKVEPDGLAQRAGVQVGDTFEEVQGMPVSQPVDIWRIVRELGDGDEVRFVVQRGGKSVELRVPAAVKR